MIVVFPAPVAPTNATRCPGSIVKETSRSTGSPSTYSNVTCSKAMRPAPRTSGFGRVPDLHGRVEERKDALGRGHGSLQHVELLRHVADGPEEALRIQQERDERPQRHRP